MTSVMLLDDVSSFFYPGKTLQIHVDICDTFQLLARFPQCNVPKQEEAVFLSFKVLESK